MPPTPVIYLRGSLAEQAELDAAARYFRVIEQRTLIRPGELVIPRYSAQPFNSELCKDIIELGGTPINSHREHSYVADLLNWYFDLGEKLTPKTWFGLDQIPRHTGAGPFVLKGATNSKKHQWLTSMYAADVAAATEVYHRLSQDSAISSQPIYIRQYVPLRQFKVGINGLPVTEEYRFFILGGKVIASGFYWSEHVEELDETFNPDAVPRSFIRDAIAAVGDKIRFWVLDVARKADGGWTVIELNDGQQAGLSTIDPDAFYGALSEALNNEAVCSPL